MKQPVITPLMKKVITGYLIIFVLLVGAIIGLRLVSQPQDIRQQASTANVDLALSAGSYTPGQELKVDVIAANLHAHQVSAFDLSLNLPAGWTVNRVVPGNFFNFRDPRLTPAPTMRAPYPTQGGNAIVFPNLTPTPGKARIALGAMCDYCFLGPTPLPTYQPQAPMPTLRACSTYGITDPACYPVSSSNIGSNTIVASYYLQVPANQTGSVTLGFDTTATQIASINNDVDVKGDLTSVTLASNVTPTVTPTGTVAACTNADIVNSSGQFVKDGYVNGYDFTFLVNNYSAIRTCTGTACNADIVNSSGQFVKDGYVNGYDFTFLVNNYSAIRLCQ